MKYKILENVVMATNERNGERKSGSYNLYTYYYFRKSSFWYLRDLNPGERNREREKEIKQTTTKLNRTHLSILVAFSTLKPMQNIEITP